MPGRWMIEKIVVYEFDEHLDPNTISNAIEALEGHTPEIVEDSDRVVAIVSLKDCGSIDLTKILAYKVLVLQDALNNIGDKRACRIELAHGDPGTEIYVCWTHRKIWEIDTSRIGSRVDDPPKTCEECEELIKKGRLATEMERVEDFD